jgi:hypothetical protein
MKINFVMPLPSTATKNVYEKQAVKWMMQEGGSPRENFVARSRSVV